MKLHPDFRDWLSALANAQVKYLVIGGYAVGFHARPRFTKDIDIWIELSPENASRMINAIEQFGFGSLGLAKVL